MDPIPILLPIGLLFIVQTGCIICIHRRVKRLEAIPPQQVWIPEPTHYGISIQPPAPSAPRGWHDSVI
jgi:hypothetical protein